MRWLPSCLEVSRPRNDRKHPNCWIAWDWDLAYNDGAAFSNFRGKTVVLSLIAFGALAMIGYTAIRATPAQRLRRVALAIIAGGAIGNLVDRLREGAVTDFVRWRIHDHRWPIFNVADAVLLVGVAVLLLDGLRARHAPLRRTE